MQVKASQAASMIIKLIKARKVPMMVGSPGMGKSAIIRQIAALYKLWVIDLRLSQCDPTDLMGFPHIFGAKAGYLPMETFPLEGDPIPEGYTGWILLLDEFNSAAQAVQAAAYKLVLDRMVGIHHLHKNVAIVCLGNLETDNAIVNPMSTAMQSRLIHIELGIDVDEFVDWAIDHNIDHRITDYIKFKPGNLYTFVPDHTDYTYACSRTWEFANDILKVTEEDDPDRLPMLAGAISEGVAREFIGYTKIYQDLPKFTQIMESPESVRVPEEPGVLYALTGAISHNANEASLTQLMKFVNRLPTEFQVVTIKDIIRRNKPLLKHPALQKWIATSGLSLF